MKDNMCVQALPHSPRQEFTAVLPNHETRENHISQSLLARENFQHYIEVAQFLSKSSLVPFKMQNKPADILIAMEMGLQIGIPMMQAIQDIAVINGKPCMYGDGLLAVVQGHKDYEWINEKIEKDNTGVLIAICSIKRRNHEPHVVKFSSADAKKASLWEKPGPWKQYPERMLQMRARGFCIRDIFADALRGIKTDEEVNDYPESAQPEKKRPADTLKELLENNETEEEANNTVVLSTMSSTEQHEKIQELLSMGHATAQFSDKRFHSALKHYGVNSIYEMTETQADEFLKKLEWVIKPVESEEAT